MTPDDIKPRQTGAAVIMVVDDTEGVRRIISMQLRTLGYRVVGARGGLEAVELIHREHPSLILMDINMPGVDGLETTRRIRQADGIGSVPIIGLSAHHGPEMRDEAIRAGCNEFAIKPVDFKLLGNLITLHLKS